MPTSFYRKSQLLLYWCRSHCYFASLWKHLPDLLRPLCVLLLVPDAPCDHSLLPRSSAWT
jgi:hypothetical protein